MTDKYAVLGNPIAHSKSPQIHAAFAEQTKQGISYEAILAPLDGFEATVRDLIAKGYKGANVTVPYKFEAYNLSNQHTERARVAGAANTLIFSENGVLADNTDGAGLIADIVHNLHFSLANKKVFLMGAGGAAAGVILPLLEAGALLSIANRTPEKAKILAKLSPNIVGDVYSAFGSDEFDVIINATSSSLLDELPPLLSRNFSKNCLAYDMMYGRETPFIKFAKAQGAQVADGLGMLVEQAAEAFYLWRGIRPQTAPVIEMLRSHN